MTEEERDEADNKARKVAAERLARPGQ